VNADYSLALPIAKARASQVSKAALENFDLKARVADLSINFSSCITRERTCDNSWCSKFSRRFVARIATYGLELGVTQPSALPSFRISGGLGGGKP
jgi:hypothetical protein